MKYLDKSRDAARAMADIAMLMGTTDEWDRGLLERIDKLVMVAGFPPPAMYATHDDYMNAAVPVWNDINVELHRAEYAMLTRDKENSKTQSPTEKGTP